MAMIHRNHLTVQEVHHGQLPVVAEDYIMLAQNQLKIKEVVVRFKTCKKLQFDLRASTVKVLMIQDVVKGFLIYN